jgi:hypothetical protein
MALSREQILSGNDRIPNLQVVQVPEWGGEVSLRPMTGKERERFEASASSKIPDGTIRARLVALSACDDRGEPLFGEADVEALADKSGVALERIFQAAIRINGVSKAAIEDLEKN